MGRTHDTPHWSILYLIHDGASASEPKSDPSLHIMTEKSRRTESASGYPLVIVSQCLCEPLSAGTGLVMAGSRVRSCRQTLSSCKSQAKPLDKDCFLLAPVIRYELQYLLRSDVSKLLRFAKWWGFWRTGDSCGCLIHALWVSSPRFVSHEGEQKAAKAFSFCISNFVFFPPFFPSSYKRVQVLSVVSASWYRAMQRPYAQALYLHSSVNQTFCLLIPHLTSQPPPGNNALAALPYLELR